MSTLWCNIWWIALGVTLGWLGYWLLDKCFRLDDDTSIDGGMTAISKAWSRTNFLPWPARASTPADDRRSLRDYNAGIGLAPMTAGQMARSDLRTKRAGTAFDATALLILIGLLATLWLLWIKGYGPSNMVCPASTSTATVTPPVAPAPVAPAAAPLVSSPRLPAALEIQTRDGAVQLTGRLESAAAKIAIQDSFAAAFGAEAVTSTLVADVAVAAAPWQDKIKDLSTLVKSWSGTGSIRLDGGVATLAGGAASADEKATKGSGLAGVLGSGIAVDNRLFIVEPSPAPAPAPESVAAAPEPPPEKVPSNIDLQSSDGKLKLLGRVDSEATRRAITGAADDVFGSENVTDALTVDQATLPIAWQSKTRSILEELKSWGSFGLIRTDGNAVTLAGTAPSEDSREARGTTLKDMLGAEVAVDNRIVVTVPAKPMVVEAPAPPLEPQPAPAPATAEPIAITVPASPPSCTDLTQGVKIGFESGRSLLDATGRRALDEIVSCLVNSAYEIVGHSDTVGDAAFNSLLSRLRAESVVKYLRSRGVTSTLNSRGAGSSQPVATNATEEGRAQNRRIEFRPI